MPVSVNNTTSVCHLTAPITLPLVGTCKSPAVLVAAADHVVSASLLHHAIFLGSPPEPMANMCLSFVTMTPRLPVGALVIAVPAESGVLFPPP